MNLVVRTVALFVVFWMLGTLLLFFFSDMDLALMIDPVLLGALGLGSGGVAWLTGAPARTEDQAGEDQVAQDEPREAQTDNAAPESDARAPSAEEIEAETMRRMAMLRTAPVAAILLLNARAGQRLLEGIKEKNAGRDWPWAAYVRESLEHPLARMWQVTGLRPDDTPLPRDRRPLDPTTHAQRRRASPEDRQINTHIQEAISMIRTSIGTLTEGDPADYGPAKVALSAAMNLLALRANVRFGQDAEALTQQLMTESKLVPLIALNNEWRDTETFTDDPLGPLWRDWTGFDPSHDAPGAAETTPPLGQADLRDRCAARLTEHIGRITASEHPDRDFVAEAFTGERISHFADLLAAKMAQTLEDGRTHSTLSDDSTLCFVGLSIQGTVDEARDWFSAEWGSYPAMLNRYVQNDIVKVSTAPVFCHLTYGEDVSGGNWVNLSLLALTGERFRKVPILAVDLVAEEDLVALRARQAI